MGPREYLLNTARTAWEIEIEFELSSCVAGLAGLNQKVPDSSIRQFLVPKCWLSCAIALSVLEVVANGVV